MTPRLLALAPLLALLAVAPSPSPVPSAKQGPEAHAHWAVAGASVKTQDLIDRGTAMLYAFDIGEARVAFAQAAEGQPDLAFPYIGEAIADTIDINMPSSADGEKRGAEAVATARTHLAHATQAERMLVDALTKRYAAGSQKQKFTRYADTLTAYTKANRDDANLLTLTGYAIYTAQDGFIDGKGNASPKAREIMDDIDRALVLDPQNLGAHHLRVHLLENLGRSQDAVSDAQVLDTYVYPPGESHLPHMAGHIWARVGDYDKLITSAQRALANDKAWFALGDGPGQEYMRQYHDHDVDFLLYGLTTVGRDDEARAAAQDESFRERARVALRLHDDAAVLAQAPPQYTAVLAVAAARSGQTQLAQTQRAKLRGDNASTQRTLVDAALARHAGDLNATVAAYARAYAATKDDLPGDPKDFWPTPIGEGYGAALLAAGKAAAAETVFADELKRFPNDPHLEWGLAEAQKAQGKDDAAARSAYRAHWKGSRDLTLAQLG